MENRLDGNAAAGALQGIFPFEMTRARVTCTNCGSLHLIGETVAYMSGIGTVIRCPGCDNALIRVTTVRGQHHLDMRGMSLLQVDGEE
jgi:phage FluMu protein Com